MNAITKRPRAEPLAITEPRTERRAAPASSLLNFVASALSNPNMDVDKLQMLLAMQREIVADDARLQFNRAMSAAQGEMLPVTRDATNDQTKSKYARLETIDAAIRPIYTRHGFLLSFNSEAIEGPDTRIVCEVSHTAGHTKQYQLPTVDDTAGPRGTANKTPLHALGSVVTYLRRYLTCMAFNIVLKNEDNDGNRQQSRTIDGRLTGDQVEELNGLMRRTFTMEGKFLSAMKLDIRSIEQAPASDFARLKNALLTKASVLRQREERDVAARMLDTYDKRTNGEARP